MDKISTALLFPLERYRWAILFVFRSSCVEKVGRRREGWRNFCIGFGEKIDKTVIFSRVNKLIHMYVYIFHLFYEYKTEISIRIFIVIFDKVVERDESEIIQNCSSIFCFFHWSWEPFPVRFRRKEGGEKKGWLYLFLSLRDIFINNAAIFWNVLPVDWCLLEKRSIYGRFVSIPLYSTSPYISKMYFPLFNLNTYILSL